jgi:YHS domain-containing protein
MNRILSTLAILVSFPIIAFAAGPPVNDVCPVCGKNARLIFRSDYKGQHVIFHSADCKDKFDKNPEKYRVTPKKD